MYYIALKYMKDEDAAMDVLQDSYLKAWQSLASLKEPGSFRAWFGTYCGEYRQKCAGKEKSRCCFLSWKEKTRKAICMSLTSRMIRPSISRSAATRRRTQELVHELIDSLSDEQRLCILMYP